MPRARKATQLFVISQHTRVQPPEGAPRVYDGWLLEIPADQTENEALHAFVATFPAGTTFHVVDAAKTRELRLTVNLGPA